ncbi:MAG: molybdopterin-synthase adenylyltransferase MoeB [Zoogloeaceae bacterium]|jgi:molybdopterin/thiamine biosynthesis adenylyltransferase|nr:molybdopterin-synthase adenylyltransferase MoeB [Zoogloeaceae bacterium]
MREWTENELERYSRHILLADVGIEGQEKLLAAKVLIIGAGGLGAPAALYLAAAGVGKIGIVDGDVVDLSNLQRQVIHSTPDIGIAKVESAKRKMRAINPDIEVDAWQTMLNADNILSIVADYDFVIDGTDNFAAKFLINDACIKAKKPFSHGGILRFAGQTMTIDPGKSACYACAFDKPPPAGLVPTCSSAGVLGPVAGMLGTIQATEALKWIGGIGAPLTDTLLSFDAKTMAFRKTALKRNPHCRVCANPEAIQLQDYEAPVCDLHERQ